MNDSITFFQQLQAKKEGLLNLISQATEYGWIDVTRKEELISKINSDTLCIGVIGQMKCGKSTFLNSFVFGDTILPAATTPMTAALSVITYGEEKKLKAEFYTPDEWSEQKMQANRNLEDVKGDSAEESKIQAAKELVEKSAKLGDQLESLLGKTQEDTLDDLEQYVGADGKYVSITKSVTIYYPADYLKGVEIVDTPGFNDPIVSREERTKEFLKRADVVVMMLYAGRPFDATDRDILFKNVRQCGIGKVLIGINKYDIPYCDEKNPEDEEKIKTYVKNELRKASQSCGDTTLTELIQETEPIPLSAQMALLAQLPMSKIEQDNDFKFAWDRQCKNFCIGTQEEMYKWSKVQDLNEAIKKLVLTEKDKILFAKPINAISAAGNEKLSQVTNSLSQCVNKLRLLNMPDDELEEQERALERTYNRTNKKIDFLDNDIDETLKEVIKRGKHRLEEDVESTCNSMRRIVENDFNLLTSMKTIDEKMNREYNKLYTNSLPRSIEAISTEAKQKVRDAVAELPYELEDIIRHHLPDYDAKDMLKVAQKSIDFDIDGRKMFSIGQEDTDSDWWTLAITSMFKVPLNILERVGSVLLHNTAKEDLLDDINKFSVSFDPNPILDKVFKNKDEIIALVKQKFVTETVGVLQKDLEDVRSKVQSKEDAKKETTAKIDQLTKQKREVEEQVESIRNLFEVQM